MVFQSQSLSQTVEELGILYHWVYWKKAFFSLIKQKTPLDKKKPATTPCSDCGSLYTRSTHGRSIQHVWLEKIV